MSSARRNFYDPMDKMFIITEETQIPDSILPQACPCNGLQWNDASRHFNSALRSKKSGIRNLEFGIGCSASSTSWRQADWTDNPRQALTRQLAVTIRSPAELR